jgi:hypothetical protein
MVMLLAAQQRLEFKITIMVKRNKTARRQEREKLKGRKK